jgi:uncharacterized membrane protein
VLFVGNITTAVFWKLHADRTGDPRIIAHAVDGLIRSDRLFTGPGAALLFLTGFGAAGVGGYSILGTGWILWSLVLFVVSGAAFGMRVAPLQRRMRAVARGEGGAAFDAARYRALSRQWMIWGMVALVTPAAALVLMVVKPGT